jgi:hypothetical protein
MGVLGRAGARPRPGSAAGRGGGRTGPGRTEARKLIILDLSEQKLLIFVDYVMAFVALRSRTGQLQGMPGLSGISGNPGTRLTRFLGVSDTFTIVTKVLQFFWFSSFIVFASCEGVKQRMHTGVYSTFHSPRVQGVKLTELYLRALTSRIYHLRGSRIMRTRGGEALTEESNDDDSESDQSRSWIKTLGPFNFPPRPRVSLANVRVSSLRDIFYIPEWVSASEEAEIIRRADSAPDSAWVAEPGRRFQVHHVMFCQ